MDITGTFRSMLELLHESPLYSYEASCTVWAANARPVDELNTVVIVTPVFSFPEVEFGQSLAEHWSHTGNTVPVEALGMTVPAMNIIETGLYEQVRECFIITRDADLVILRQSARDGSITELDTTEYSGPAVDTIRTIGAAAWPVEEPTTTPT